MVHRLNWTPPRLTFTRGFELMLTETVKVYWRFWFEEGSLKWTVPAAFDTNMSIKCDLSLQCAQIELLNTRLSRATIWRIESVHSMEQTGANLSFHEFLSEMTNTGTILIQLSHTVYCIATRYGMQMKFVL